MTVASPPVSTCSLGFACPRCHGPLAESIDAYSCAACRTRFPIVLGIPDFRLAPDPWIGLDEDREKARRLESTTRGASLEAMVRAYWAMTPGTPAAQANRFVTHVLGAADRSREWVRALGTPAVTDTWLDVGSGTGDLATVVAEQGAPATAVDVAMRWLVVARRRAELAGADVRVVCCNAEHLPFPAGSFGRVASLGTLEHCRDAAVALVESRRVLHRGGDVRLRTVNRFAITPEPHVGIWGVGYVPRRFANRYVRMRGGQGYEHHRPLSPRELGRYLRRAGFQNVRVEAAPLLATERVRIGAAGWAVRAYDIARGTPVARTAARWAAPLLEASGVAA